MFPIVWISESNACISVIIQLLWDSFAPKDKINTSEHFERRFDKTDYENGYSRNLLWRLWEAAKLLQMNHLFALCCEAIDRYLYNIYTISIQYLRILEHLSSEIKIPAIIFVVMPARCVTRPSTGTSTTLCRWHFTLGNREGNNKEKKNCILQTIMAYVYFFSTVNLVNQFRCWNVACTFLSISSTRVSGLSTSRRRCLSCAGTSTTTSSHTPTSSSSTKPPSGICWKRGCPRPRSQSLSTTTCWGLWPLY